MSGGHFNFIQDKITVAAEEIQRILEVEKILDSYISDPKVMEKFLEGLTVLQAAAVYLQRIDWLVSGDDDPKSFLSRLEEEIKQLQIPIQPLEPLLRDLRLNVSGSAPAPNTLLPRRVKVFEQYQIPATFKWGVREKCEGIFHRFGFDVQEDEQGFSSYSVAIVELDDGKIILPCADKIQFI